MNNAYQDSDPLEEKMIRAGAFNPDDLMFNQAGELSPRQKRWLMVESVGWRVQIAIELALIVCAWLFYYFQFQYDAEPLWWIGGLFWSVILGIGIFLSIEHAQPLWTDIKNNEVQSVAGIISKHAGWGQGAPQGRRRTPGANWGLEIRNITFSIGPAIYDSLIEHQTYRAFYMPTLKRVINIEPLFNLNTEKQSALAALQQHAKENEE